LGEAVFFFVNKEHERYTLNPPEINYHEIPDSYLHKKTIFVNKCLLIRIEIMEYHLPSFEFNVLYKQFYRKAFCFTKSYVHDDLVAEDITSESLIKLWEQIRRTEIHHPGVFLLTILKNKSLDYLKHKVIKETAFDELKNIHQTELDMRISMLEACDPEEIFAKEIQQIVEDTLAQFPEQTRLVFEMSRFGNQSNKEIAEELGFTVKNVEYHITKVLKVLRTSLKDYLPLFCFFFFNINMI
jgi:RNA polymerase sigma-70 factor (ECF subfamily)